MSYIAKSRINNDIIQHPINQFKYVNLFSEDMYPVCYLAFKLT